jgi:hypothetical protein
MVRKQGIRRGEDGGYGVGELKKDQRWLQRAPGVYKKLFNASRTNPGLNPMRERFLIKWQQVAYRVEGGGGGPYGNKRR